MKILVNENTYTRLTKEEALRYFENDIENLELLKNETHIAYLFFKTEWLGKLIQYAVVEKDFKPENIDEWEEEDWIFVEEIIKLIGD